METIYRPIDNRHRWDGQRTETVEKNLLEIRNVIATQTQESIGNNAKNRTMGADGSQRVIGPDAWNMGLRLRTESVKKEPRNPMYTAVLAAVKENSSEPSSGCKGGFGGQKCILRKNGVDGI